MTEEKQVENNDSELEAALDIDRDMENEEAKVFFEDRYKRALADYQNLQRQTAKEKLDIVRYANERLLLELLPVYDHLKTALKFAPEEKNNWLEGVQYVIKQFKTVLADNGVEEIVTEGKVFDHHSMDAVEQKPTDDKKLDNKVAGEIKAGYKLNGKVVVAAKVAVYKFNK